MPQSPPPTPRPGGSRPHGFTIVELVVTMAILVVASGILVRTLAGTSGMRTVNRENALSIEGGRQVLEAMRDQPFEQLFALYNPDDLDDPGGPATAPGSTFVVPGLEPVEGAGGQHGTIEMPLMLVEIPPPPPEEEGEEGRGGEGGGELAAAESTFEWQLREDFVDEELGMPRDLNGDNVIDAEDHSEDYVVLPVRVRMSWKGLGGNRSTQLHTMFTEFTKQF